MQQKAAHRDLSPIRIVNWEKKTTSRKNALPVKNLARIRRYENSIKVNARYEWNSVEMVRWTYCEFVTKQHLIKDL